MDDQRDTCPSNLEWLAEQYCLDQLPAEVAARFEDHYLMCPACAQLVAETQEFVDALRLALPDASSDRGHSDWFA